MAHIRVQDADEVRRERVFCGGEAVCAPADARREGGEQLQQVRERAKGVRARMLRTEAWFLDRTAWARTRGASSAILQRA